MVEIAREAGVDARVGDVQELPFGDASFDCAVAAWMLYHVPDLDRGLAELARVLRQGGRLVAATNSIDNMHELWRLVGRDRGTEDVRFFAENGEEPLRRHFSRPSSAATWSARCPSRASRFATTSRTRSATRTWPRAFLRSTSHSRSRGA